MAHQTGLMFREAGEQPEEEKGKIGRPFSQKKKKKKTGKIGETPLQYCHIEPIEGAPHEGEKWGRKPGCMAVAGKKKGVQKKPPKGKGGLKQK